MDEKTEAPVDRLNCRQEGSTGQQEIKMNPIQQKKTKRTASIAGGPGTAFTGPYIRLIIGAGVR